MFFRLLLSACFVLVTATYSFAEIANFVGPVASSPTNDNGVSLRTGSVPPQEGVELFVFNPSGSGDPFTLPDPPFETEYTIPFQVSEKPAMVVAIPGEISNYEYTENTSGNMSFPHTLTITFTHERYAGGVAADLPGPPGDFAVAIIPAVGVGEEGLPAAMRGAYMATNISPNSWQVIPPDEEDPDFGFELNGPAGEEAFFDFFVPNSMVDFLSDALDETLTIEDLALFNNNQQASVSVIDTGLGGLIEVDVKFAANSNGVSEQEDDAAETIASYAGTRARSVSEKLTVEPQRPISLTASKKFVKDGKRVRLYGWVKDGVPGRRVKITSKASRASGRSAVVKRVRLKDDGSYSAKFRMTETDQFRAIYKPVGLRAIKSKKRNVKVR